MKRNKNKKYTSAAAAVREVIATFDKGFIFSGYDLKNEAVKLYADGVNMYVDTFLREMRHFCANDYELLSRSESLYRKTTPSRRQIRNEIIKKYAEAKQLELFTGAE